jgi:hypothetical protein
MSLANNLSRPNTVTGSDGRTRAGLRGPGLQ